MAEAEELIPIEQGEAVADEEEYLKKLKEHFKEDFDLCQETDVRRVIRGYAGEKNRWEDTVEHLAIWIKALKEDFAGCGFKPMEDQEAYKNMQKWAQFTVFGQDKYGHPVMYENIAEYDCDKITKNLQQALKFRRRVFSQMWNKKMADSKKTGKTIYKQINVFNLKNIGVMSANKFKNVVQQLIKEEGDLFPETVYKMFFINTGWTFKAAWAIVSLFVHPKTKEKIQFCGSDFIERIKDDVPANQIPKEFGGTCEAQLVWGETSFDEPAVEQFPDLLAPKKKSEEIVEKAEDKKPVENAPAAVAEEAATS